MMAETGQGKAGRQLRYGRDWIGRIEGTDGRSSEMGETEDKRNARGYKVVGAESGNRG